MATTVAPAIPVGRSVRGTSVQAQSAPALAAADKLEKLKKKQTEANLPLPITEGGSYNGQYVTFHDNNVKHGLGELHYKDGTVYKGTWNNDLREGQGLVVLPSGDCLQGTWANNVVNGKAKFYFARKQKLSEEQWMEGVALRILHLHALPALERLRRAPQPIRIIKEWHTLVHPDHPPAPSLGFYTAGFLSELISKLSTNDLFLKNLLDLVEKWHTFALDTEVVLALPDLDHGCFLSVYDVVLGSRFLEIVLKHYFQQQTLFAKDDLMLRVLNTLLVGKPPYKDILGYMRSLPASLRTPKTAVWFNSLLSPLMPSVVGECVGVQPAISSLEERIRTRLSLPDAVVSPLLSIPLFRCYKLTLKYLVHEDKAKQLEIAREKLLREECQTDEEKKMVTDFAGILTKQLRDWTMATLHHIRDMIAEILPRSQYNNGPELDEAKRLEGEIGQLYEEKCKSMKITPKPLPLGLGGTAKATSPRRDSSSLPPSSAGPSSSAVVTKIGDSFFNMFNSVWGYMTNDAPPPESTQPHPTPPSTPKTSTTTDNKAPSPEGNRPPTRLSNLNFPPSRISRRTVLFEKDDSAPPSARGTAPVDEEEEGVDTSPQKRVLSNIPPDVKTDTESPLCFVSINDHLPGLVFAGSIGLVGALARAYEEYFDMCVSILENEAFPVTLFIKDPMTQKETLAMLYSFNTGIPSIHLDKLRSATLYLLSKFLQNDNKDSIKLDLLEFGLDPLKEHLQSPRPFLHGDTLEYLACLSSGAEAIREKIVAQFGLTPILTKLTDGKTELVRAAAARAVANLCFNETYKKELVGHKDALKSLLEFTKLGQVQINSVIRETELVRDKLLGTGTFAKVYRGTYHGREVAIKVFSESSLEFRLEDFYKEVAIMCILSHENIVHCEGACIERKRDAESTFIIVTELMQKGTLKSYISAAKGPLPIDMTLKYSIDIANAMAYIHSLDIIHRDLKAENVLLNSKDQAKVADLGLAREVDIDNGMTLMAGTPKWEAPEVLVSKKGKRNYSTAADVYSFGIVLFEMVSGEEPFADIHDLFELKKAVCDKHQRPKVPKKTPEPLRVLIKSCWHKEPTKRPPMVEVLNTLRKIRSGEKK